PEELNGVHDTFYVSNLKKCLADPTLQVFVDEIQIDAKLNFVEELVEILRESLRKGYAYPSICVVIGAAGYAYPEFIEADRKAKHLETELQNQFILDRDKIRALEKERDDLQLNVSEQRKHVLELQNAQTVLKRKLNANEDKYLDDVLTLEAKLKKNENVVIKMSQSVQALFMLGPKPLSFYDTKLKHGLG
ncbi:hypothetical protein Tco_1234135, partial [Tanacetum coccineum]